MYAMGSNDIDMEAQRPVGRQDSPVDEKPLSYVGTSSPQTATSTQDLFNTSNGSRPNMTRFTAGIYRNFNKLFEFLRTSQAEDGPADPLIVRKMRKDPDGYPDVATFLDSDDNFMMYRRFGWVQSRLLLEKQYNMAKLEAELEAMDQRDRDEKPERLRSRSARGPAAERRTALFQKAEVQYNEYATLMASAQKLASMNRPTSADYKSVTNYFFNNSPLIFEDETWVRCKEDLVTLKPGREHAWLDDAIEHLLRKLGSSFVNSIFRSEETNLKSSNTNEEVYYTRSRIDLLVSGIITLMILVLLIVPIYVLFTLIMSSGPNLDGRTIALCIATLIIFTLAFSAVLSLFTRARRHEILAAAAAYCAVLVVFFGNVKPDG